MYATAKPQDPLLKRCDALNIIANPLFPIFRGHNMAAQIVANNQTNFVELQESVVEFEEIANRLMVKCGLGWEIWERWGALQRDAKKTNSKLAKMCEKTGQLRREFESRIKNNPERNYTYPNEEVMAKSVEIPAILTEKGFGVYPAAVPEPGNRADALFIAELEPLQMENRSLTNEAAAATIETKDCQSQLQTRDSRVTETEDELLAATNLIQELDEELRQRVAGMNEDKERSSALTDTIAKHELDLKVGKDKVQ